MTSELYHLIGVLIHRTKPDIWWGAMLDRDDQIIEIARLYGFNFKKIDPSYMSFEDRNHAILFLLTMLEHEYDS